MLASAGRRVRPAGTRAWTAANGNRRWPTGVVKDAIWPRSAQRRRVLGVTPSVRLASPSVSQRFWSTGLGAGRSFLAKTTQIYHPFPTSRGRWRDAQRRYFSTSGEGGEV